MIGIFDSGVGGLSVLREVIRLLPEESYIYYSDNAHCPYGEKSREYIIDRARFITEYLVKEGADIIVIACNTATAAAISTLRKEYSDPENGDTRARLLALSGGRIDHIRFIGTEPAIKPAISMTASGVIGVLATAGTLKAEKYRHTRELADGKVRVVEHVGKGFVELVENGKTSGPETEKTVAESVLPLVKEGADTIVLGCTHYPFLNDMIRKVAGEGVKIINPAPAIARHLIDVMKEESLLSQGQGNGAGSRVVLHSSGNPETLENFFSLISR